MRGRYRLALAARLLSQLKRDREHGLSLLALVAEGRMYAREISPGVGGAPAEPA